MKGKVALPVFLYTLGIFAIDSTVIKLALSCIASYPYRSKKAAAKMHTRLPVGSFIPSVVCVEAGKPHDSTMADELTKDMKGGDILLADRAYVDFAFLHNLTAREVFWVLRQRREMVFLTNNTRWAASTICELYKARWDIEVFFKELKQTLQLTDFIGTNENAVKWQIWTGLLTHLLLHYLKFLSGWGKAFSRLVGIVRSAVWMDLDILETLRLYGMVVSCPPSLSSAVRRKCLRHMRHSGNSSKTFDSRASSSVRFSTPTDRVTRPAS